MSSSFTARPTMTTNLSIRKYVKIFDQPVDSSDWTTFREIPSSHEIFDQGRTEHTEAVEVHENIVVGPYSSKSDYLERQYSLLREDAVAPLRDVVSEVQAYHRMMESESDNSAYIYEKVSQNNQSIGAVTENSIRLGFHNRLYLCQSWDCC